MGRTSPTYRNQIQNMKSEWKNYRNTLRKKPKNILIYCLSMEKTMRILRAIKTIETT